MKYTQKLRFSEFQDAPEWEEKPLCKIANPVSERAIEEKKYNILTLSSEYGLVAQGDYFGKKIAGENNERYIKIECDDFVYNDRTTKVSEYGTIKRLSKYDSGIVSPIYKCFRFDKEQNPVFWEWYFESGFHDEQLRSLINEGARAGRFNISISKFLSTIVWYPKPIEQQKIADCLCSVDELITAQSAKVEALKAHKKALMQQLFPAEGETTPRLRFPEFRDAPEWEEKKLSEISTYVDYRGRAPIKTETGYFLVTAKNIKKGYIDYNCSKEYVAEDDYLNVMSKGLPEIGDILFTTEAPLGNVALVDNKNIALAQRVIKFRNKEMISNIYLLQCMLSDIFQEAISCKSIGSTVQGISGKELHQIKLLIPSLNEQQKIADCLSSIDELIAAQSAKVEALKTHKKALMQQLFPLAKEL